MAVRVNAIYNIRWVLKRKINIQALYSQQSLNDSKSNITLVRSCVDFGKENSKENQIISTWCKISQAGKTVGASKNLKAELHFQPVHSTTQEDNQVHVMNEYFL